MDSEFILPQLSPWYKKKFLQYATQVLESQQKMSASTGKNILHYTLQDNERHERFKHYPSKERIDSSTGAQYFYHCHREDYETTEHGHFHCFLRYKHIPKLIKPSALDDWDRYMKNPMTHLIAIGMSQVGMPIRLFTVNRWVSTEIWYDAIHAPKLLNRFNFKTTPESDSYWHVLDKWVEGILHLFSPQISWLHHERDKLIHSYQEKDPNENIYLKQEIEELSSIDINLQKQVEWIIS